MKMRKDSGEMGFKDLITFNRVMLGRQAWRMIENLSTLRIQLFKRLYFPRTEGIPTFVGMTKFASW